MSALVADVVAQKEQNQGLQRDLSVLEKFGFSGAVLVKERRHSILSRGYGAVGDDPKDRITPHTAFDIASLAKQFTAAAVLLLESENKLQVSDTVARFFPEAPVPIRSITIHQLLTHTSGLPGGNVTPNQTTELDHLSRDLAVAHIFKSKLKFAPGAQQAYSNAGYVLLAAIIEKASEMTYRQFVRNRLWRTAHLRDSRFWGESSASPVALGKDELGIVTDPRRYPSENWSVQGAGGILSSISDLQRWFESLQDGRVLPLQAVRRMFSPQFGTFGYGWRINPIGTEHNAVNHGGDYPGFGSQLIWQPRAQRLVILLMNIRHDFDTFPTRLKVQDVIIGRLDGTPARLPLLIHPTKTNVLKVGIFATPNGLRFRVRKVKGSLLIGALNQPATDFLGANVVDSETTIYRNNLTARTDRAVEAAIRHDPTGVKNALASTDDPAYVYEQLVRELQELLNNRSASEVTALGTYPASTPKGALWSVVEIKTQSGSVNYMLRWYRDVVGSYHLRAPSESNCLTMVPSGRGWIAWDIIRDEEVIQINPTGGAGDTIELTNSNLKITASWTTD